MDMEEYRLLDGYGRSRKLRSHRYELIPLELTDCVGFSEKGEYLAAFPADLPTRFTAKIFGNHTRLRGYALYDAIAVFESLGALERVGKEGRSTVFERRI